MINEDGIYKWKYQTNKQKEDVYNNFINSYNFLNNEEYLNLSEEDKQEYLQDVLQEIRKINIFPIIYFNEQGIKKEIKSVFQKDICFVDDVLYTKASQGLLLLDYLFPNLHLAECYNINGNNVYNRFYNDDKLLFCLNKAFSSPTKVSNMRTLYFKISRFYWNTPINFPPIRAKAIYEKFCPPNGIIYDYSAGYGGRMLGALSSSHNFTYIATDPNKNTYHNLLKLGSYIEQVSNRHNSYYIYNLQSEKLILEQKSIDFIFSCPPFFKKEIYSNESNQSTQNYPIYEDWLEHYVRPTIKNCFIALKENGFYGVDIMNYCYAGKKFELIKDWIRIAEEEGFYYRQSYQIRSQFRNKSSQDSEKIYIFTKSPNIEIKDYSSLQVQNNYGDYVIKNLDKINLRQQINFIGEYDILGNLIKTYSSYSEVNRDIKEIKNNKMTSDLKYFRIYKNNEVILNHIDVKKPVCKINNYYFFSMAEAGRYLNVSRQAVQQAKNRQAKKILDNEIEWII